MGNRMNINRKIFPNRWLVWTIAISVFVTIVLVGYLRKAAIEMEQEAIEASIAPLALHEADFSR